jgi:hypothetical protein
MMHGERTGKGNGAGRRSLVKYNQPQSTAMLELEELTLSFSAESMHWEHRCRGGLNSRVDEESTPKSCHGSQ